jgi:bacterioferritin
MKGDPKVIEALNGGLTIELTAITSISARPRCARTGATSEMAAKHYEESIGEMKHAEKLIDRILFLEVPEIAL